MTKFIENKLIIVLLIIFVLPSQTTSADVLRVNGGFSSGAYIDGLNVTNEEPLVFLNADWSFDNGAFIGGDCYQSSSERGESLERGCHAYLGLFKKINDNQAVSFELRHNRYLVRSGFFWTDNELVANWHLNKNLTLSVKGNDNWLDHGNATLSVKGDYSKRISNRFSSYVSVSLMQFESTSDLGVTELLEVGVKYQKKRWLVDLGAVFSDAALVDATGFDVSQNQLKLTLSYQLY